MEDEKLLCEICRDELGSPYAFVYGNASSSFQEDGGGVSYSSTTTHYQMKGTESALIGDLCIDEERSKRGRKDILWIGPAGLILFAVTIWGFLEHTKTPEFPLSLAIIFGIISLFFVILFFAQLLFPSQFVNLDKKQLGGLLAITVRRDSLESEFINFFCLPEQWEEIRRKSFVQSIR